MVSLSSWSAIESDYYLKSLEDTNKGSRTYPVHLALGSLIIKERLGFYDEETVISIIENSYL